MKRLLTLGLAGLLAASTGCHMFAKKKKPVDPTAENSKTLAADTEKEFMQRWLDKRTTELVAQGLTPNDAHVQAVEEYKKTFPYTAIAAQVK